MGSEMCIRDRFEGVQKKDVYGTKPNPALHTRIIEYVFFSEDSRETYNLFVSEDAEVERPHEDEDYYGTDSALCTTDEWIKCVDLDAVDIDLYFPYDDDHGCMMVTYPLETYEKDLFPYGKYVKEKANGKGLLN